MPVGFIVEQAIRQPDNFIHSQVIAEDRFDLFAGQVRVAVAIEQALFGGDQRALAIHVDRAAFEHKALGDVTRAALDFQHFAAQLRIEIPRRIQAAIEAAPCVEFPVHAAHFATVVDDERRPAVAHPGVVAAHFHNTDVRHVQARPGVVVLRSGHGHRDRLKAGDGLGDGNVGSLGGLATQAPVVRALGPDHPDLGLRCPFGRHVETIGAWRAIERGHGDQDSSEPSRVFTAPYRFGRRSRNVPQALRMCSSSSRSKLWTSTPSSVSLSSATFSPNWLAMNDEP